MSKVPNFLVFENRGVLSLFGTVAAPLDQFQYQSAGKKFQRFCQIYSIFSFGTRRMFDAGIIRTYGHISINWERDPVGIRKKFRYYENLEENTDEFNV